MQFHTLFFYCSSTNKNHVDNSNSAPNGGTGSSGSGNRAGMSRSRARIMRGSSAIRGGSSSGGNSSGGRIGPPGVIMGGGSGSSSRPIASVPAPFVPEDLITQAQVVLQGKSRNLIIRELQVCLIDVFFVILLKFKFNWNFINIFFIAYKFRCKFSSK